MDELKAIQEDLKVLRSRLVGCYAKETNSNHIKLIGGLDWRLITLIDKFEDVLITYDKSKPWKKS